MALEMPKIPAGNGKHPILLVALTAHNMPASTAFYSKVFGWQMLSISPTLTAAMTPGGPAVSLRSDVPEGFQGAVPFVVVGDVKTELQHAIDNGATLERAPWNVPMMGTLARFKDASGTVYGITSAMAPGEIPPMPLPMGSNPKPPVNAICHLEMFAADGAAAAAFFTKMFEWGTLPTMPNYVAFETGAGVGGIFQSHSPSAPGVAYVYCADVEAKLTEIEAAGGTRSAPPMKIPGAITFGYFKDPSGTNMGLIGP